MWQAERGEGLCTWGEALAERKVHMLARTWETTQGGRRGPLRAEKQVWKTITFLLGFWDSG
jgi:hypothetical protein